LLPQTIDVNELSAFVEVVMTDYVSTPYAPLTSLYGKPLAWVEVKSWRACYELRAGDQVVANMEMDGVLKVTASAHSAEGSWHLARHGLFKMVASVTTDTQSEPILRLDNVWWDGGSIILPNGRKLLAESLPDLTMLLSLGWYLMVRHMMDAAAASVVVSGVVAS
jgi:nitrogen fixation protein